MRKTQIVCRDHPQFVVKDINAGLPILLEHVLNRHDATPTDMDFISMFREEPQ